MRRLAWNTNNVIAFSKETMKLISGQKFSISVLYKIIP